MICRRCNRPIRYNRLTEDWSPARKGEGRQCPVAFPGGCEPEGGE